MLKHVYIIAEVGVNHNGSLERAKKMVEEAAIAGVDAVKFQLFKTENLMTRQAPKADYQMLTTNRDESQFDMTKKLELSLDDLKTLFKVCQEKNVDFLTTPFDSESLNDLVHGCDVSTIKIPSGEITNAAFLLDIAHTQKNVILSTGMSTLGEIETALGILAYGYLAEEKPKGLGEIRQVFAEKKAHMILREKVQLLHCTTEYPAPYDEVNLNAIDTMRKAFQLPVGYSDHTRGIAIALAAVAKGASIIEKHFTLDRELPGPDHKASLEPEELRNLVNGIRQIEVALGDGIKKPSNEERRNILIARKSLVVADDIIKGEKFTEENLTAKRPCDGLSPLYYWDLLGKCSDRDYKKDDKVKL